jgi:hypothetical protein
MLAFVNHPATTDRRDLVLALKNYRTTDPPLLPTHRFLPACALLIPPLGQVTKSCGRAMNEPT